MRDRQSAVEVILAYKYLSSSIFTGLIKPKDSHCEGDYYQVEHNRRALLPLLY